MFEDPGTRPGDRGAEMVPEMQASHWGLVMEVPKDSDIAHWMDRREAWHPKKEVMGSHSLPFFSPHSQVSK